MSIESLKQQIDAEYDLWIEKGERVMIDGKVTCAEAKEWVAWYKERKRQLLLLKKELNLHLRGIRSEYRLKSSQAQTRKVKGLCANNVFNSLNPMSISSNVWKDYCWKAKNCVQV